MRTSKPQTAAYVTKQWLRAWEGFWGRALYDYYNWRQDTVGDLKLVTALFASMVVAGTVVLRFLVDNQDDRQHASLWTNFYQVTHNNLVG